MLTQVLLLAAFLSSPIAISLLVLWSAHRGYVQSGEQGGGA